MKRRQFMMTAGMAALVGTVTRDARAADAGGAQQVLEFRTYQFMSEEKLKIFSDFLAQAMIPALNRIGVSPVGAFRLMKADNPKLQLATDELVIRLLLPHAHAESALTLAYRLAADEAYAAASLKVLDTPQKDPVYARFEAQLLLAFPQCPKVEVPSQAMERVVQLRIYESHNDERALRKIEMFNEGGEIGIFRRVGMNPVFFGQSIAGTKLPNLHYMLSFDSTTAQDKAWNAFRADPAWLKLKDDPRYKDTVSNITNLVLRPLPRSQV